MKEQALWSTYAGSLPPLATASTLPEQVDVAVVGGGLTGLAAALSLARIGASVAVLEQHSIGWGASGRSGGQVSAGAKRGVASWMDEYGLEMARRLWAASVESVTFVEHLIETERIECSYARVGLAAVAWRPEHFGLLAATQKQMAVDFVHQYTLVPPVRLEEEVGSPVYHGALVDELAGMLNPYLFTRGLAGAVARRGAQLFEHTAVTGIVPVGVGLEVTTTAGAVRAGEVVVATNGYTGTATPWLQKRLVPVGSHIIATEPLERELALSCLPRRRVVYDTKNMLFYFTLSADDRMVFGGRASWSPVSARRSAAIMRRHMVHVFPQLEQARIEHTWSGNVCFTRDLDPHLGYVDGYHFCAGYCGHGMALATYLGDAVGRRLAGEPVENPFFELKRPARVPLYHGRPWFLPLAGGYFRARDRLG